MTLATPTEPTVSPSDVSEEPSKTPTSAPVPTRLYQVPWRGYFSTLRAKLGGGGDAALSQ